MSSAAETPQVDIRFEAKDRPPHLLSLGLGLQFALLSIGGIVLTPVIIVRAAGTGEAYLTWAVFGVLCVSGVSTVIQAVKVGRIGAGYILLMGTSGTFIAVSETALVEGGPGLLATLVVASSLFQFALSSHLSLLRRLLTPVVSGTVIMLIAVTIMPIVFDMLADVPESTPPTGGPACAAATLVATIFVALLAKGAWRLWAPTIGAVVGCITASFYGLYDTARVAETPWIGLPTGAWPGFDLEFGVPFWTLLPVFVLVTVVGAIETIGDAIGIQQVSWRKPRATDFRAVQGAVAADGMGNLLSGLMGTIPNTTYSSSIAVTELTGVASRSVGVCIGIVLGIAAFFPKLTAVILAVPSPVIAAYVTVLIALLFTVGMRIVVQDGVDYRKSVVVGLSFWLGVGFQNQQVYPDLLGDTLGSMLGNGMTAGGLCAILMMLCLNLAMPRPKRIQTKLAMQSLPKILEFLRTCAKEGRWSAASTERLCAAGEEAILSLLHEDEDESAKDEQGEEPARALNVSVRTAATSAELEFIASTGGANLEDRIALLGQWAEQSASHDISLRLLRHYASSVRHQQYHGIEVVTVHVAGDARPRRRR